MTARVAGEVKEDTLVPPPPVATEPMQFPLGELRHPSHSNSPDGGEDLSSSSGLDTDPKKKRKRKSRFRRKGEKVARYFLLV